MAKIKFEHGGPEYDKRYPDGIPTSVVITTADGRSHDSGLVMYPAGHARNTTANLRDILAAKFRMLGSLAVDSPDEIIGRFDGIGTLSDDRLADLYHFELLQRDSID